MLLCLLLLTFLRGIVSEYCMCVPFWQCSEDDSFLEDHPEIPDSESTKCPGYFDVCCKVSCGQRGTDNININVHDAKKRILGNDNEAIFAEFPWMLGVIYSRAYRCGASLIHPKAAITAAHCVQRKGTYRIRAGEWNWNNRQEPLGHQDRITKKIIIHPQYNPKNLENDIAVLILDRPFQLNENVGIVCLPSKNFATNSEECVVSGWGRNSPHADSVNSILKKIELPLVPANECERILRQVRLGPYFTLHESFICAGGEFNKDTCKGDGGSPLVCPAERNVNKYYQTGIVSWGLTCGVKNTPGVYVNVAMFRGWIDGQMRENKLDYRIYA